MRLHLCPQPSETVCLWTLHLLRRNRHQGRTPTAPTHPKRFAGDRYEVLRHLGDGGTKRVFLVRDTRLDREVALALVRTEGLDATGRERVARGAVDGPARRAPEPRHGARRG